MCRRRPLEEVHKETLRFIISLPATAWLFIRKRHELFFAEAAAQVDEWVRLIFPVTVVRTFVFRELGSCGGIEGCA